MNEIIVIVILAVLLWVAMWRRRVWKRRYRDLRADVVRRAFERVGLTYHKGSKAFSEGYYDPLVNPYGREPGSLRHLHRGDAEWPETIEEK